MSTTPEYKAFNSRQAPNKRLLACLRWNNAHCLELFQRSSDVITPIH